MSIAENHLTEQIEAKAREIHSDAYPMSIGELMSLYRDDELDIHPDFQRFFRWSDVQKSKFIESLLLGIPIPSIFVSQREDGVWDVVDGVQRLSTIFEFTGILKDRDGKSRSPSQLVATDYLPSLEGMVWEDKGNPASAFPDSLRRDFKRAKLDLNIIKKQSDESTRFDLFERLNTLGSQLSEQEIRNCLLIMIDPKFYEWLEGLSGESAFQETLVLTDRALDERYDMELALRFIVLICEPEDQLRSVRDVSSYLTERMKKIATDSKFDRKKVKRVFRLTFEAIQSALGTEGFTRPAGTRGRGGFLVSVFEVLAMGLGWNIMESPDCVPTPDVIKKTADALWEDPIFRRHSRSGVSAKSRLPNLVPLGRRLFQVK